MAISTPKHSCLGVSNEDICVIINQLDSYIMNIMVDRVNSKYTQLCNTPSDINEHLPTLYRYAKECNTVFETGVRGCISSWAFTKGLLENGKESR